MPTAVTTTGKVARVTTATGPYAGQRESKLDQPYLKARTFEIVRKLMRLVRLLFVRALLVTADGLIAMATAFDVNSVAVRRPAADRHIG